MVKKVSVQHVSCLLGELIANTLVGGVLNQIVLAYEPKVGNVSSDIIFKALREIHTVVEVLKSGKEPFEVVVIFKLFNKRLIRINYADKVT